MNEHRQTPVGRPIVASMRQLGVFVVLTYAITWILLGPWFYLFQHVLHRTVTWWIVLLAPFAFLGAWGPSVAAVILEHRERGWPAVRQLLARASAWRVPFGWYAFVFLIPLLATAGAIVASPRAPAFWPAVEPGAILRQMPLAYVLALPFGPLEEFGWRGYALPRLLDCFGAWGATLVLGTIWTFWHGPMILLMPGAALPEFMPVTTTNVLIYLVRTIAETGLMTTVFIRTKGSILLAILFHMSLNASETIVFAGFPPLESGVQREIYARSTAILLVAATVALAWVGRIHRKSPTPTARDRPSPRQFS